MISPGYRPDIDGLRAIAVSSVVIFHAFPDLLRGGFVGVDVFFVISGFLITTIIVRNMESGTFEFKEFYRRRINRIAPALLLVLTAVLGMGYIVLLADEFEQLGKHGLGAVTFSSNLILWSESGYFDEAGSAKPLLHLWSLGIEEQFYLLWPAILYLGWRFGANLVAITFTLLALSFVGNIWLVHRDPVMTFYFPATRFWELLAGAALAQIPRSEKRIVNEIKSCLGFALVVSALGLVRETDTFPGWWALMPVVGAALLIDAGPRGSVNRYILSKPFLVWLGLISYPLYLWHWPLLSFAHILSFNEPSVLLRLTLVAASVALAAVTYRLVEPQFRHTKQPVRGAVVLTSVATFIGAVAFAVYVTEGVPNRSVAEVTKVFSDAADDWDYEPTTLRHGSIDGLNVLVGQTPQSVLFIGDSLVGQYYPRAKALYANDPKPWFTTVFASRNHCTPIPRLNIRSTPDNAFCGDYYEAAIKLASQSRYERIVIGGHWRDPTSLAMQDIYRELTDDLVSLKRMGKQIYLIQSPPNSPEFSPAALVKKLRNGFLTGSKVGETDVSVRRSLIEDSGTETEEMIASIADEAGATVIDPYDYFCTIETCPAMIDGTPLYVDYIHLRASYAKVAATFIDDIVSIKGSR